MDRTKWKLWADQLSWTCPNCQTGTLRPIHGTFQEVESRRERYDDGNPDEKLKRFIALLKCDYRSCGETATVAGDHLTHWLNDGSDHGYIDEGYKIFSIVPSPLPFNLDIKVPPAIAAIVREAAALFWVDHKAAANRSREVIEAILTNLGVPATGPQGGKRPLHSRIEAFGKIENGKWLEQANVFEAAKWIGNEGTHATISRDDALDAFEMLEMVLDDIYVRARHSLLEKVQATNSKYRKTKVP
jgi:hypothetical protein